MSIVSGTIGAVLGAKSQDKATRANRKNVQETNELNRQMFREARGAGGSAILPLYLRTKGGQLFERQLGRDIVEAYDQLVPRSAEEYRRELTPVDAMREQARGRVGTLFSGQMANELMENAEPVQRARTALNRQAAIEALNRTTNAINAAQATQGFTGDSMANRRLTYEAQKAAADQVAAAELENLMEDRAIRDEVLRLQLQNASLPYDLAQQELAYLRLPQQFYIQDVLDRTRPLQFLNIGPGAAFRADQLPIEGAQTSPWQLLAQSSAALGNTALNYWLKQQQANQYASQFPAGVAPVYSNQFGSYTAAGTGAPASILRTPAQEAAFNAVAAEYQ